MKRRKFLTSVSMLAAASVGESPLLYGGEGAYQPLIPVVDTHQHLVDVERFGKDWSHPPVPGNYGVKAYKEAIKGLNVVKAVYMEVAVPPYKRLDEARYAMELCGDKSGPTVGAVISADLYMDDFRGYMSQFRNSSCIKGIRAGFKSRESLTDSRILDNIRFLGDMDMRFDFIVPSAWFPDMVKLIRACDGTQFQADHCANADPKAFFDHDKLHSKPDHDRDEWIDGITALASEKNVVCKISGLVSRLSGYPVTAENLAPAIHHCLDIFGADRVMFASDWPWCLRGMTLSGWVNLLKEVVKNRSLEDQGKLFHDNAIRHYKI
ncbi:amidohydrolase family protein [Dyadobacter bucti]|uniref:amidohydrolase family protein n=1 Tax=Dyadobacter bucti TaxID=2572203 RepID=UPI003F7225C9